MVSAARESLTASPLPRVECKQLDSQDLSSIPDNYFTHSIMNFSIFTFVRPADAVRETYRTLRPGGLAVFTCWRRFAPVRIVHSAQEKIHPGRSLPMPMPNPQFLEEEVLQKVVEEGGFAEDNIKVIDKTLLIKDDENIAGLTTFMSGPMMAKAREGYTEAEELRWATEVKTSVTEEIKEYGGIKFEAYILLATK
ncbi:hypothetical protein RRF57_007920 [Xylaria bambusicola]|uniref:Methyltransferase type 11 domain-containing protein n=1 Tax=Xylaria bambusicola TaxID=326684 RepID=A0AAN7USU3_9PEZI